MLAFITYLSLSENPSTAYFDTVYGIKLRANLPHIIPLMMMRQRDFRTSGRNALVTLIIPYRFTLTHCSICSSGNISNAVIVPPTPALFTRPHKPESQENKQSFSTNKDTTLNFYLYS